MKKMKGILIIAAAFTVICCVLLIFRQGISNHRNISDSGSIHGGEGTGRPYAVSSFSYYRGGGMENEHYRVTLEANKLTVENRIGQKTTRKKYKVPDDVISEIEKALNDSGMKDWSGDFPQSEFFALDADTTSIEIDFGDGTHIEFDSDQIVPDGGWEAVRKTMDLLESIADK